MWRGVRPRPASCNEADLQAENSAEGSPSHHPPPPIMTQPGVTEIQAHWDIQQGFIMPYNRVGSELGLV